MAPAASAATVVYVGNAESNEIIVLQLDRRNGDLTVVEKVSIPGIEKPGGSTPMAVSPDRRVLYVGTRGEPKVAAGSRHVRFHPRGTPVYVVGELDGAVHVFDYSAGNGRLTAKQSVSALPPGFQGTPAAADLHVTSDGQFLYASERTSSTL